MKNSAKVPTQFVVPFCLVPILILFGSLLTSALPLEAQAPVALTPAIEAKAQAMLAKLTLEQKIELIGGVDGMFTNAIPAINLPRFKMSGIRWSAHLGTNHRLCGWSCPGGNLGPQLCPRIG